MSIPSLPDALSRPPLHLTADLPGIGGTIKRELEDFIVEEIPAYLPSGQGEHLYLWVEKRDMGGEYFQRQVAQRLEIDPGSIGMAGLKDRRAVTRQWISVPQSAEAGLDRLSGDGIHLLQVQRHGNKLRPGHLRGNRFTVLIREAAQTGNLEPILQRIGQDGLPNYYGSQRFGRDQETLWLGWKMLHGERVQAGRFLRKLGYSALQSAIFNCYLCRRIEDGLFRQVLDGDVMGKWPAGGMFITHDPPAEQERFNRREIVHTGPMFGSSMRRAEGPAEDREARLLESLQLGPESFQGQGKLLEGTRRHNLIYVDDLSWSEESDGVRLKFTLPAGAYATVLLAEVMKSTVAADPAD